MSIDLSNENLKKQIEVFYGLKEKPSFSICDDIGVNILFLQRQDKYYAIRTAEKTDYSSPTEFLVSSFMIEEICAHVKKKLALQDLNVKECSLDELSSLFVRVKKIENQLPNISDIQSARTIVNSSNINWVFLEEKCKYHSLFWSESETKLFSRCA